MEKNWTLSKKSIKEKKTKVKENSKFSKKNLIQMRVSCWFPILCSDLSDDFKTPWPTCLCGCWQIDSVTLKARYLSTTTHAHAQIHVRASPSVLASYSTLFKEIEKRKHMKEELFMTYIIKPALG